VPYPEEVQLVENFAVESVLQVAVVLAQLVPVVAEVYWD
jgi:hypothetical protein